MDNNEKKTILTYEKNGLKTSLMLNNHDLIKDANMSFSSANYFFQMLSTYLQFYEFYECELISKYLILKDEFSSIKTGELIIPNEQYDEILKSLFSFAYISCSKKGIKNSVKTYNEHNLLVNALYTCQKLKEEDKVFHTLYIDSNGNYKVAVSDEKYSEEAFNDELSLIRKKY